MAQYYDGTKLLSMKDINGKRPEIFMSTTNRTGGKTTYFSRLLVNHFLNKKTRKFGLVYRYSYDLDDVSEKFFKVIGELFFQGRTMTHKMRAKGKYAELYLDDVACGYAVALNDAEFIKKNSSLFSDIDEMMMDEFQSETNRYLPEEISKLLSVHTSIARGHGMQVRYVPLYMCANQVSVINPYYVEMGISTRLRNDTRFLRGDGFVLENGFVESASRAQKESGFNRAFAANKYVGYASENVYLNDNTAFVEEPEGRGRYLATLRYEGCDYGIREYADAGIIYCDKRPDSSFPTRISVTTDDHNVNYVMLKRNSFFIGNLRFFFEHGAFRFKDLKCKEAVMKALSY